MTSLTQTPLSRPVVIAIGGSDSAGMAGIQADLRAIQALGGHGAVAITAVTAQHSGAVLGVNPVSDEVLTQQLDAAKALSPQAIKIGLLASAAQVRICAQFIRGFGESVPVVLDPVFASSSGTAMTDAEAMMVMREELMPLCTLITPNRAEAEQLLEQPLPECPKERLRMTRHLRDELIAKSTSDSGEAPALLLTGGHWRGTTSQDLFHGTGLCDTGQYFWLSSPRIDTCHQRGTGCTLASATATALALGYHLADAVVIGKMAVNQGLRHGYGWPARDDATPLAGSQPAPRQSVSQHAPQQSAFQQPAPQQPAPQQGGPLYVTAFPADGQDLPWLAASLPSDEQRDPFPDCGPEPLGLYPVVDRAHWLEILLPAGISTLQLRVKDLEGDALRDELARAIEIAHKYDARLFINDYWQLAIELDAYGVHLGQEDLDSADITAIRAAGLRLGISTHCHYEVARAVRYQPSYLACGPVYPTISKDMPWRPHGPSGLAYWREVLRDYPLVAIGGIGRERLAAISAVGPDAIAMITGLTLAVDPQATAREFMAVMATHAPDRSRSDTTTGSPQSPERSV